FLGPASVPQSPPPTTPSAPIRRVLPPSGSDVNLSPRSNTNSSSRSNVNPFSKLKTKPSTKPSANASSKSRTILPSKPDGAPASAQSPHLHSASSTVHSSPPSTANSSPLSASEPSQANTVSSSQSGVGPSAAPRVYSSVELLMDPSLVSWSKGPISDHIRTVCPLDPPTLRSMGSSVQFVPIAAVDIVGYLYLDYRSMIRAALWMEEHPDDELHHLIPFFLSRGVAFAWRVPYTPMTTPLRRPQYLQPLLTPEWWAGPEGATFAGYKEAVASVLARPHARQWLLRRGLAWRLAIKFGTHELRTWVLDGPSTSAIFYGHGTTYDIPQRVIGDRPSAEETAVLTGATPSGSIWPSLSIWENSLMWIGEWSEAAEFWFERRLCQLCAAETETVMSLLSDRSWNRELRAALRPADRHLGSEDGSLRRAKEIVWTRSDTTSFVLVPVSGTLSPPA
ncbi:hypothetical protein EVG20_g11468, partial [Dentipellis fragilis]